MNVLAGCDFFTVEVLSWRGLVTYYVLFPLHLESRRVTVAGITQHPEQHWMEQVGRSATHEEWGYLHPCRYVLHDRDKKFCEGFRSVLAAGGVKTIVLPAKSPNLNAFAERWVRSVKQECLSKLVLFGEASLWRVLTEYCAHYHGERNHQKKDNRLLFPGPKAKSKPLQGFATLPLSSRRTSQILQRMPHEYFDLSGVSRTPHISKPSRNAWRIRPPDPHSLTPACGLLHCSFASPDRVAVVTSIAPVARNCKANR